MRKQSYFLVLLAWLMAFAAGAQPLNITGRVMLFSETTDTGGVPLGFVNVRIQPLNSGLAASDVLTDENGFYTFTFAGNVPTPPTWRVSAEDLCTEELQTVTFQTVEGQTDYAVNFVLCGGITPPPPPEGCAAFFYWEQTYDGEDSTVYIVQFFDVSYPQGEGIITGWTWDFGDGTTSTEQNPVHTYTEPGLYVVTLRIQGDDCDQTIVQIVEVTDLVFCACPQIYAPVCVDTPAGQQITFPNACYAECAGYTADEYASCEGNECGCPEFFAPVCVMLPDSTIFQFDNACFAACEGYDADAWVSCDSACPCPTIYDPVCVATPSGLILTFGNACEAECAGYTADVYYPCDGGACACPQIYAPVCVELEDGSIFEFTNACYAACEGFTEADFVTCEGTGCYVDFWYEFPNEADYLTLTFESMLLDTDIVTTWLWDFGDGNTSTEATPTHTYAEGGSYEVTLTVETVTCGTLSTVLHVFMGEDGGFGTPNCQAFFFFMQPDSSNLLTFQFVELPLGEAQFLLWDFGDGNTSSEPNPIHTYAEAGNYDVTLIVTAGECTSIVLIPVQAGQNVWYGDNACRAWFLPIINSSTSQVYFVNLSSEDAIEFAWDFGDGNTSADPLAFHTYTEPGTYTATLTITTASGCVNEFSVTIDVAGGGFTGTPVFALLSSTSEPTQLAALTAAPNPTRDVANISWQPTQAGEYTWQLLDLNGRTVAANKGQATAGLETLTVDMHTLPAGIYLFRLQTTEGWQTMRLSKM